MAAAALPLAAICATTAFAESADPSGQNARIDASDRSVPLGDRTSLRGAFPGASQASIEILHRATHTGDWRAVRDARTDASGRYSVRVEPRQNGRWRAEVATSPPEAALQQSAPPSEPPPAGVDTTTGSERIDVRARIETRLSDRHTLVGDRVKVRGKVSPAGAQRRVVVTIGKARETTRATRDGRFEITWQAPDTGTDAVRVRARANHLATGSRERAGKVTAYREASASWYGPGLYGNPMACGGTLTPSTMGVAHRTMPCGTKLRLRHDGETVAVRVVDRGPFAAGREFDLTEATKRELGFGDLGTVLTSK